MTAADLIVQRLRRQFLLKPSSRGPEDVVASLGAVQSQDYPGARWAVGQRMRSATAKSIDEAFDAGRILRTHVMRPTWHFVAARDIRWLIALSRPQLDATTAYYCRRLGVTVPAIARASRVIERALTGETSLTRTELALHLRRARLPASGTPLAFVLMRAEIDGLICSGPRRGNQFTYMRLDARVPAAPDLTRDEALAELARRFFDTHGPATVRDYSWWSGLLVRDVRKSIDLIRRELETREIGGLAYWHVPASGRQQLKVPLVHLLPNYDEYFVAYQDREAVLGLSAKPPNPRAFFAHFLVIDGRLAGTWFRRQSSRGVSIEVKPFRTLTRVESAAIDVQIERHRKFQT